MQHEQEVHMCIYQWDNFLTLEMTEMLLGLEHWTWEAHTTHITQEFKSAVL